MIYRVTYPATLALLKGPCSLKTARAYLAGLEQASPALAAGARIECRARDDWSAGPLDWAPVGSSA